MTQTLHFPAGPVTIDASHVSRARDAWQVKTGGSIETWFNGGGRHHAKLTVEHGTKPFVGSSRLGTDDAIAQALQAYEMHEMCSAEGDGERDTEGHSE